MQNLKSTLFKHLTLYRLNCRIIGIFLIKFNFKLINIITFIQFEVEKYKKIN